jgi:three-Cys-motif partner protein
MGEGTADVANDSDPSKWECPPHTKAKHDMLASYLDGWFPILASWNGRVVFLDGFAGRGRYNDGAEGSPLVALRRLLDHRHFPQMAHREFVFYFVEADSDNAESLDQEIAKLKAEKAPWPTNVKVNVVNEKFDVTAQWMLDTLREQKANLAPTFAFVDPFGYSGLPINVLAELLSYPKTELFVNFMVGHVQRFIEREGQENAMRNLFGMEPADVLADERPGESRIEHLRRVYEKQLRELVGFPYVNSFAMKNSTGNVGYHLFHGTRHPAGVKLMKAAMWKVDPGGGNVFSDRLAGLDVLFEASPDLAPLRTAMLKKYSGQRGVLVKDIEWFAILETPYRETHIRSVLKPLETDGLIAVQRPGKTGFPPETTRIDFL